ncbi:hypothetical protein PTSG_04976 [Salpingoeca rosetta]|uniref:HYR domain-containing protein n=1 Tax=Salpingoeca rosetta (strain ATCC 50818 / BSB-021) TaxID=946362 RepID=F2U960_SALR5|nr:uncharacterized protein PTSG_04976 [Salpingoeca rosetta]EGD73263.1 hypothetical protein PTSG_04976 [Salpingoeca rosetta]|eukprot:XP_004994294.1 hypothetical protein PTSG_04976 [Salpingoeca rosetta]
MMWQVAAVLVVAVATTTLFPTARAFCWASCDVGEYCDFMSCRQCPPGRVQPKNNHLDESCDTCQSGKYQDRPGQATCKPWSKCDAGTFYRQGTNTLDTTCLPCLPGTYQNKLEHTDSTCETCPFGKYQNNFGQSGCKSWSSCGAGERWIVGLTVSDASCTDCSDGMFQDSTSHQSPTCRPWQPCPEGKFVSSLPTITTDRVCMSCAAGSFSNDRNQDTCTVCPTGKFQDAAGQRGCNLCPIGTYASQPRTIECRTCATGKYANETGLSKCKTCSSCPTGLSPSPACSPTTDTVCKDTTPPVITARRPDSGSVIEGPAYVYTVVQHMKFQPPVVTATDTYSNATIVEPSYDSVSTAFVGSTQALAYTAMDEAGNQASISITVNVIDDNAPQLVFSPATLHLEAGLTPTAEDYTRGVTVLATDAVLNSSRLVYDPASVSVQQLGNYTVLYELLWAEDSSAQSVRNVIVADTTKPDLRVDFGLREVHAGNEVWHEAAITFVYPVVTASDSFDTTINSSSVISAEFPRFRPFVEDDTTFAFTYAVSDASDNLATVTYVVRVVDTMAPTVTITGDPSVTHEAGTEYVDAGATASDLLEDALERTIDITTLNTVDVYPASVPAVFTVEYTACDKAGNCNNASRAVTVVDTQPPTIELVGPSQLQVEAGSELADIDPGAHVSDAYNAPSQLRLSIDDGGYAAQPASVPATFNITYTVSDTSNHTASITREITVIDTTPPDVRLNGALDTVVGDGVGWVEPGIASAYDNADGDVRPRVEVRVVAQTVGTAAAASSCVYSSARDFVPSVAPRVWPSPALDAVEASAPSGTVYRINYTVTDASDNVAHVERVVRVVDGSAPTMQLVGEQLVQLEFGGGSSSGGGDGEEGAGEDGSGAFADPGVTAHDAHDGDVSGNVCVNVSVVTANATGVLAVGSVADVAAYAVTHVVQQQEKQEEQQDDDGDGGGGGGGGEGGEGVVGLGGAVAWAEVGTVYVMQYSVQDRAGHAAAVVRRAVVVVDTTPPEVTLYGAEEVHVPYATRYVEAGYSAQDVHDGNVTSRVVVRGADAIDVHVAGAYEIEYAVSDVNGNTGVAVRTVVVDALTRPDDDEDAVVELVLAGTAEVIFGGDVPQLEADLEEALGVEFVVVFLVYDSADGRPSDGSGNNDSVSSGSSVRKRREAPSTPAAVPMTTATEMTVVEFGVRDPGTLAWMSTTEVLTLLDGVVVLGTSAVLSASAYDPDLGTSTSSGGSNASVSLTVIIAAAAGGVVFVAMVVVVVSLLRRRSKRQQLAKTTLEAAQNPYQSVPHNGLETINPAFCGTDDFDTGKIAGECDCCHNSLEFSFILSLSFTVPCHLSFRCCRLVSGTSEHGAPLKVLQAQPAHTWDEADYDTTFTSGYVDTGILNMQPEYDVVTEGGVVEDNVYESAEDAVA